VTGITLQFPLVRVIPRDEEPFEIQTSIHDARMFERTAKLHKWGTVEENRTGWLMFIAWSACRREKTIGPSVRFEEDWSPTILDVQNTADDDKDEDEDEDGPGSPTPPGPLPG
jgi:hypothetical protein